MNKANLPERRYKQILKYPLPVIELLNTGIDEVREVFIRINSTGKALTRDEKRNAALADNAVFQRIVRCAERKLILNVLQEGRVLNHSGFQRQKHIGFVANVVLSLCEDCPIDKTAAVDRILRPGDNRLTMPRLEKCIRAMESAFRATRHLGEDFVRSTRFNRMGDFYSLIYLLAKYDLERVVLDKKKLLQAGMILRGFSTEVNELVERRRQRLRVGAEGPVTKYLNSLMEGSDSRRNRTLRHNILADLLDSLFVRKDKHRTATDVQRMIVWEHSDQRCANPKCGKKLKWGEFQVDHIIPFSKGGRSVIKNFAILCPGCNRKKGSGRCAW